MRMGRNTAVVWFQNQVELDIFIHYFERNPKLNDQMFFWTKSQILSPLNVCSKIEISTTLYTNEKDVL